jgi:hypothetical protein
MLVHEDISAILSAKSEVMAAQMLDIYSKMLDNHHRPQFMGIRRHGTFGIKRVMLAVSLT